MPRHPLYSGLLWTGLALTLGSLALVAVPLENDAVSRLVEWIRPTNRYYDAFRLELSIAILGLFLVWAGTALPRLFPDPGNLPPFHWHPHFVAGLAICPLYWIGHHEMFGIPGWIWAEDGPMEYLTVLLLGLAALYAGAALRHGRKLFSTAERRLLGLFILALLVLAAEEISWGQRILDIETPPALKDSNVQGEINLHNLTVGWNEVFRMAVACLLSALIWLNEADRLPFLTGRLDALKPPHGLFFWLPLLMIPGHLYDELFEQIVSFAILAYAMALRRRAIIATQS
jgi:hypothetical protein